MACFHFFGKYPSLGQLWKTLVSSCIAGSGRFFFRAMYGIVSSPGLVLFPSDFRALLVSSLVMVLEYSSDAASGALHGVRCKSITDSENKTVPL